MQGRNKSQFKSLNSKRHSGLASIHYIHLTLFFLDLLSEFSPKATAKSDSLYWHGAEL